MTLLETHPHVLESTQLENSHFNSGNVYDKGQDDLT